MPSLDETCSSERSPREPPPPWPGRREARHEVEPHAEAVGMLFDSTLCVGCRACQTACKEANKLPADAVTANGGVYDAPNDLNSTTRTSSRPRPPGTRSTT